MKQSVNSVNIEGIVSEINLREIDKTQETGKKYVAGEVVVQVADAEGKINMIPVSFISADLIRCTCVVCVALSRY